MWVSLATIAAIGLVFVGHCAGNSVAEKDIARLQLVWPYVQDMSDADRALLAGLALTCRLHVKDEDADAVVACLREAAGDPDAMLPKDVLPIEASDRLERLISLSEILQK